MDSLREIIAGLAAAPPFMIPGDGPQPKLNLSRSLESIIIAVLAAAASVYGTQKVIETKLEYIEKRLDRQEARIDKIEYPNARIQ